MRREGNLPTVGPFDMRHRAWPDSPISSPSLHPENDRCQSHRQAERGSVCGRADQRGCGVDGCVEERQARHRPQGLEAKTRDSPLPSQVTSPSEFYIHEGTPCLPLSHTDGAYYCPSVESLFCPPPSLSREPALIARRPMSSWRAYYTTPARGMHSISGERDRRMEGGLQQTAEHAPPPW